MGWAAEILGGGVWMKAAGGLIVLLLAHRLTVEREQTRERSAAVRSKVAPAFERVAGLLRNIAQAAGPAECPSPPFHFLDSDRGGLGVPEVLAPLLRREHLDEIQRLLAMAARWHAVGLAEISVLQTVDRDYLTLGSRKALKELEWMRARWEKDVLAAPRRIARWHHECAVKFGSYALPPTEGPASPRGGGTPQSYLVRREDGSGGEGDPQ